MNPVHVRQPVETDPRREIEAVRRMLEDQFGQIQALSARVESLARGQAALQGGWLQVRDELWSRQDEIQAVVYDQQALRATPGEDIKAAAYRQLIRRVREVARNALPREGLVLVVSKGDRELLDLYGRRAMHFPQTAGGVYAGAYPANSAAAIVHLEAHRARGADFLVFPATALWWLDHYAEFGQHLERRCRLVLRQEDTCAIFSLRDPPATGAARALAEFDQMLAQFESRFDRDPAVLDWNSGLALATAFPHRAVFSPPTAAPRLPHLDASVDIVVAPSNPDRLEEAARVSAMAVAGVTQAGLRVEWKSDRLASHASPLPRVSLIIPSAEVLVNPGPTLDAWMETFGGDLRGEIILAADAGQGARAGAISDRQAATDSCLRHVVPPGDMSLGETCNFAARAASGEIVVVLSSPIAPVPGWLPPLLRIFRSRPNAAVACGKLAYLDGRLAAAGGLVFADGSLGGLGDGEFDLEAPLFNYVRELEACLGPFVAVRRDSFLEAGGFDRRYHTPNYLSADYCFRVREQGHQVCYQPESAVILLRDSLPVVQASNGNYGAAASDRARFIARWVHRLRAQPQRPERLDRAAWHTLASGV